jgi:hypothetical protein
LEAEEISNESEMSNIQSQIAEFRQTAALIRQEIERMRLEAEQIGNRLGQMVEQTLENPQMDRNSE